eukprot:TRINITY_DN49253_c0_g1_i1.p1 TRINITY_DN49253_c0_g1~~TRINITY_DN49253_c0_g1_i1.p1  ORF type:complete len:483 (-),score=87.06 TRINITY_DN49253_c0_g1_i1:162-1610(-)
MEERLSGCLSGGLADVAAVAASLQTLQRKLLEAQDELSSMKQQREQLQAQLAAAQEEVSTSRAENDLQTATLVAVTQDAKITEERLKAVEGQLKKEETRSAQLADALASSEEQLASQLLKQNSATAEFKEQLAKKDASIVDLAGQLAQVRATVNCQLTSKKRARDDSVDNDDTKHEPSCGTKAESDNLGVWGGNVREIVRIHGSVHIQDLIWHWDTMFPDCNINDRPVKKLKSAINTYVDGVVVDKEDVVSLMPASRSRSRGRRPPSAAAAAHSDAASVDVEVIKVGGVDLRKPSDEDVWALMRQVIESSTTEVKHEGDTASLTSQQVTLLKQLASGAPWKCDPAFTPRLAEELRYKIQNIRITDLLHTHGNVSKTFRVAPHSGRSVFSLTDALLDGATRIPDIPPLVVGDLHGKLWVICGNRRLVALKKYVECTGRVETKMPCIVHKLKQNAPAELIAKFILSSSTDNGGIFATVAGAPPV